MSGVSPALHPAPSMLVLGVTRPIETFLARLLRGLAGEGVRVTVASAAGPGPDLDDPRIEWLRTPSWSGPPPARLARVVAGYAGAVVTSRADLRRIRPVVDAGGEGVGRIAAWHRILPFLGRRRWDVLYFPWNSAAIAYEPLFELGVPCVISCRGAQVNIAPHTPGREKFCAGLERTLRCAAAVHCVSDAIRDAATAFGLDPARARVIRPAVDPERFRPGAASAGLDLDPVDRPLSIITTGSIIWRKGHEYALRAVAVLRDRGVSVRLVIAGDGPDRRRVLFTADDLGICDRVDLLGRCSPDEVIGRLQASDVFLLTSLSEGISNAVLEAMSCGLPVVTTACEAMGEAVADGRDGIVVPVRDPVAIADAVERLAHAPALRRKMGRAARERILRDFRLDEQVRAFLALLQDVAAEGGP